MASYEAWADPTDSSTTLATREEIAHHRAHGLLSSNAVLLYQFEAATFEEANAIHALRMGWAPYTPGGEAAPCPRCGAVYYPEGSGECWRCARAVSQ